MATRKITELTSGSLSSLPLTGVTTVVYSGVTFQHTLNHLRQVLVDSGSHVFTGSQTIKGDLIISGSLTAQQYILSSSVTNIVTETISGSTEFGNSIDDTHNFTGSLIVTGSLIINGTSYTAATSGTSGTSGDSLFAQTGSFWATTNNIQVTGSLTVPTITGSLEGTSSWSRNSITSSYPIDINGTTIFTPFDIGNFSTNGSILLGQNAGSGSIDSYYSNFIGVQSGQLATNSYASNFIGLYAGYLSSNSFSSNFIGEQSGNQADNSDGSNFIGSFAGRQSNFSNNSNFIGKFAGNSAKYSQNSNFIGTNSGNSAVSASYSNFIGNSAGFNAVTSSFSNFIGYRAGQNVQSSSYSTLIGYQVSYKSSGINIGSNNIIIGTNITLADGRKDSINIGGLIFGSGSYNTITGNPSSGSANGKVGINQPLPNYSLDVSGSGRYTNGLEITGSLDIRNVTENILIGGGFSGSTFDYTSGSIFYLTGLTGNGTWDITNVPTTNNKAITLTFVITQGVTPYSASAYQFNSSNVTVKWADSTIPTGSANKTDVIGLTAFRVGSTWNVLGSLSSFGS
jgi:hypothetical protein